MKAVPSTPRATLRIVPSDSVTRPGPRAPARRLATAWAARAPASAWVSSTPATITAIRNCSMPRPALATAASSQPLNALTWVSTWARAAPRLVEARAQNWCTGPPISGQPATEFGRRRHAHPAIAQMRGEALHVLDQDRGQHPDRAKQKDQPHDRHQRRCQPRVPAKPPFQAHEPGVAGDRDDHAPDQRQQERTDDLQAPQPKQGHQTDLDRGIERFARKARILAGGIRHVSNPRWAGDQHAGMSRRWQRGMTPTPAAAQPL